MDQGFKKTEHLSSEKLIKTLFTEGESLFVYPFKLLFLKTPTVQPSAVQVMVMVSKKHFKSAVDRNQIKRYMREAYRKNKVLLEAYYQKKESTLLLGFIYTGKTILSSKELERKLILILRRLTEQDEETAG